MWFRIVLSAILFSLSQTLVEAGELRPFKPQAAARVSETTKKVLDIYARSTIGKVGTYVEFPAGTPIRESMHKYFSLGDLIVMETIKRQLDTAGCHYVGPKLKAAGIVYFTIKNNSTPEPCLDKVTKIEVKTINLPYWAELTVFNENKFGQVIVPSDLAILQQSGDLPKRFGIDAIRLVKRIDDFKDLLKKHNLKVLKPFSEKASKKFFNAALNKDAMATIYYGALSTIVDEKLRSKDVK